MEKTNDLKIVGNLSSGTHTGVSVIKATYGLRSMEETMKFILEMFGLVDEDEKKKYIDNYNLKILESGENL